MLFSFNFPAFINRVFLKQQGSFKHGSVDLGTVIWISDHLTDVVMIGPDRQTLGGISADLRWV